MFPLMSLVDGYHQRGAEQKYPGEDEVTNSLSRTIVKGRFVQPYGGIQWVNKVGVGLAGLDHSNEVLASELVGDPAQWPLGCTVSEDSATDNVARDCNLVG
jgi:hypothetical protein